MKRLFIIALAITVSLTALMFAPGAAFADNPPHGGFTATADGCAGCHRAHTAAAPKLLINTGYALCMTCHGVTTGGASTDVLDGLGVSTTPNGALKGGGFANAKMNHDWATTPITGTATTSRHGVNGYPGYTNGTVWGNGSVVSPTLSAGYAGFVLECTSCHNPHGKAGMVGTTPSPSYRLLRYTPSGTGPTFGSANVTDVTAKTYTIADTTTFKYYGQTYPDNTTGSVLTDLSPWCATCHTRIHTGAVTGPGSNSSGDAVFTFRHRTSGTSVENNFGTATVIPSGAPACLTCHVAHGTNATMGAWSSTVNEPGGTAHLDSTLLRVDNRGVCELCHNK